MSNITLNYIKSKRDQNLSFFVPDGVKTETTLGVIEKTEVLVSLGDRDNIHETSRVGLISPDFAVNLNMPLHQDGDDFTVCQSVLQLVPDDQDERKAFSRLVGSRRGLGSLQETVFKTTCYNAYVMNGIETQVLRFKEKRTKAPPSLSRSQCLGALSLFRCFFNPLAYIQNIKGQNKHKPKRQNYHIG